MQIHSAQTYAKGLPCLSVGSWRIKANQANDVHTRVPCSQCQRGGLGQFPEELEDTTASWPALESTDLTGRVDAIKTPFTQEM